MEFQTNFDGFERILVEPTICQAVTWENVYKIMTILNDADEKEKERIIRILIFQKKKFRFISFNNMADTSALVEKTTTK